MTTDQSDVCSVCYAGVHRVLQRAGGGEHSGQFCGRLRAAGWADGLWLPTDYRQQDPPGVRLPTHTHTHIHTHTISCMLRVVLNHSSPSLRFADTSLRKEPSSRWQSPKCRPPSPTLSPGGQRGSNTRRTRSLSMSSSPSTYWWEGITHCETHWELLKAISSLSGICSCITWSHFFC